MARLKKLKKGDWDNEFKWIEKTFVIGNETYVTYKVNIVNFNYV